MFGLEWQGWVTVVVFILVFYALVRELFIPGIVMVAGAAVLLITRVLTIGEFMGGFSRGIIFTLAMLFIIARAMEATGILNWIAGKALPKKNGGAVQLAKLMLPVSGFSAFLNNTPIVLMLTSVVRKWAVDQGEAPSKFLIPLSFAAILGGMCTLIGTAPNLIVDGLLHATNPAARFGFFELALIGVPCLLAGTLYMIFVGRHLLPERKEPAEMAQEGVREFTGEFQVLDGCPWVGKSIHEIQSEYLIELRRDGAIFASPSPNMVIRSGDTLVFVGDLGDIAKFHAVNGLQSLEDPKFTLDVHSPFVSEVVVAVNSWLAGKTVRQVTFRTRYGASVVGVYRSGQRVKGSVGDIVLRAGDTLLLLSNQPWHPNRSVLTDFYPIRHSEELPILLPKRAIFVVGVLIAMIVAVLFRVPILIASTAAAGILLVSRTVNLRQAARGIDWGLLLLVAGAFSIGTALIKTGVAQLIAHGVLAVVGSEPHLLIGGIFLITMLVTEVITNAAAALMLFPFALQTASLAGYTSLIAIKAVGITVAIAASSSFLTPIGYQTNTIVYGPGGYRFSDYVKVGAPLTVIQLLLGGWLIPLIWPLQ